MTERRRPLIGSHCFLELERFPDAKMCYIDPEHVVDISPSDEGDGITELRLYSSGGVRLVLGDPGELVLLVQQARQMVADVTLETLVTIVT